MTENPFGPDVISAVAHHMNDDHPDDSLLIVRTLGDTPEATDAEVTHLDGTGVDFTVAVGDDQRTVRVPWNQPLSERPQIRQEFVRMYLEATEQLGVTPRQTEQH